MTIRDKAGWIAACLVTLAASTALWGLLGTAGGLIGLASGWGSFGLLRFMVRGSVVPGASKPAAVSRLQLAFLTKIPLLALVIFFTNSLGRAAVFGFILGFFLVYSALLASLVIRERSGEWKD